MSWLKKFLEKLIQQPPVPPTSPPPKPPAAAPGVSSTPVPPPAIARASSPAPAASPRPTTLNLDASAFAPLAGAQIKSALSGKGGDSWSIFRGMANTDNTFWGNRSVIPPSTDPRTHFIDRGMVGQGLITPEELAQIHTVGDEMIRLRPGIDYANAHAASVAARAVQQAKAAKGEIKKQKKAEAQRKKDVHAGAVKERKATDILYLGRGVSKGLADRRANIEKLQSAGLPVMATPADVARAMGLTIPQLRWLAFDSEATTRPHYIRFTVPKKSGGTRELAAPHKKLRSAQNWILAHILERLPAHPAAHGFVKNRNTRTNAALHLQPAVLINCDLENFFPTINVQRVIGLFADIGYSPAVATVLALLCTEAPRRVVEYAGQTFHVATAIPALPQGACTSPGISNLITRRLDSRLSGICGKLNFTYTRYADDLTFSAARSSLPKDDPQHPNQKIGYLLARIRHITSDEGFVVNEKKTRIQRPNMSQRVTGVIVNAPTPAVPRKIRRRLRAILHQAQTTGLSRQNKSEHPHFAPWVRGMIAYIHMINPTHAQPLRAALQRLGQ